MIGTQIAREAKEVFYEENPFVVYPFLLPKLVQGEYTVEGAGSALDSPSIIRDVSVILNLDIVWSYQESKVVVPSKCAREVAEESGEATALRSLLRFKNAQQIRLEIQGGGSICGSDLVTQQEIREISKVVRDLITAYGDRFSIIKSRRNRDPKPWLDCVDLKPYWDPPSEETKRRVQHATASLKDMMQVQIEE